MFKSAAVFPHAGKTSEQQSGKKPIFGFLLIDQRDRIIYANQQARHFLGLMSDELLPFRQTFMTLVESAYECYPAGAWQGWPKRPSPATTRRLVYKPQDNDLFFQLKVEVLEQIIIDEMPVWVVSMVEEITETAVSLPPNC